MLGSFLSPRSPTLLGLFSLLSGIQGDCGPPPKLSNAIPLNNAESFPHMESVTYRCLDDFYNVYGKLDVATCLSDSTWTSIEEFCERTCPGPPRFRFAKIKDGVIETYHPAKTSVTYVCRPGHDTIPGINSVITCLDNYTWTTLPVFCEGKSCGDPGELEHGEVVVLTNLLYLAKVNFICEEGYRLIGSPSTKCVLKGDRVEWQTKPPECQPITTPILLTKRPTEKEDNFTAITTLTTSIHLMKRPTEKEDDFTGLQLGDVIGIIVPVLVVLCTAVIVGSILWQKKKRSYDLNQEATKSIVL
ncbi:complement decay-accelerating factor isoform X2 [Anolis carolinensis]|uniref:complement decay-accelerating factor isoform X2 n=1 Tax=Anolis carolinensis TaxID=28377 RepID=UPI002F2B5EEB